MNILLLGYPALTSAFQELGHDVLTCTTDQAGDVWVPTFPVPIEHVLQALPSGWSPDFVFLMDESTEPMYLGLERLEVPTAWYTLDAHLHLHWHKAYAAVFDFVFVAQRDYVASYEFDPDRQTVRWLPLFCQPARDRHARLDKLYEVSFVGMLNDRWKPARSALLKALSERLPLYIGSGEYVTVFNRSKIVLNECAANDVNFRVFEALSCGTLLLTERVGNGFEELFRDREHLVMYDRHDLDQIVELAEFYLAHDEERERIAQAGRALVLERHTALHRALTIDHVVSSTDVESQIRLRKARLPEVLFLLTQVYDYAAGVYELASRRHADSPAASGFLTHAKEMFSAMSAQIRRAHQLEFPLG